MLKSGPNGAIPVAILTTSAGEYGLPLAFDATTIDPVSVRLGLSDTVWFETGGATPRHNRGHVEDSYELDEVTQDGDNDMVGIIEALLDEEQHREGLPPGRCRIPMRPDHGHAMGEERSDERVRPGYSYAGRLKGLAELRGVVHALTSVRAKR